MRPRTLALPAAVVAAGAALPIVYLVIRFSADAGGGLVYLARARTLWLTIRTLTLTATVTAGATALGFALALLTSRTDIPGRKAFSVLAALPLVIPSYIAAFAFSTAFSPNGLAQQALEPLGVGRLPNLFGFPGAAIVLIAICYPFVFIATRAALDGIDPQFEEAAATLGAGRPRALVRITLPQLRPAIASGALFAALYTLHDFGAVSLLRYDTFTRAIYSEYRASFDTGPLVGLGVVVSVISIAVLSLEAQTRGRAVYHRTHAGSGRRHRPVALGRWRWPAASLTALTVIAGLGLPLGVLGYWLARGLSAGEPLRLSAAALAGSLRASAGGTALTVAAALPLALYLARSRGRPAAVLNLLSYSGYALPGIVAGLALVFFGIRVAPPIYQTHVLLAGAYLILFLPLAVGPARTAFLQSPPRIEEAARTLGAGPRAVLARVTLPLAGSGLGGAAALVFLNTMKELPATLLLAPPGFTTLATQTWSAANGAFFARAALPALVLVLTSSLPLGWLLIRSRKAVL